MTKHHNQKASRAGKGLIGLHLHSVVHSQRQLGEELTQSRKLEAGAGAKDMEGCCFLTCAPLLSLLSYGTQNYQPTMCWVFFHQSLTNPQNKET